MSKKCLIDEQHLMTLFGCFTIITQQKKITDCENMNAVKKAVLDSINNPIDLDRWTVFPRGLNGQKLEEVKYGQLSYYVSNPALKGGDDD